MRHEHHAALQTEKHYKRLLAADVEELSALQRLLDAADGYAVLLIFQAMDVAERMAQSATS